MRSTPLSAREFTDSVIKPIHNLPVTLMQPLREIRESRPVLVVTSAPAWKAVGGILSGINVRKLLEVYEATTTCWEALLPQNAALGLEAVFAVGGGLSADAGKYFSNRFHLPLTVIPTALSVDAFLTAASGVRRDGCVVYIDTVVPNYVLLDLEVIAAAPSSIRAAGITDVLSITTGCWDWKFAHERGMNPPGMPFIQWVYDNAQSILSGAVDCAEAAGCGDLDGLKTLYDCLAMEVQLCNQVGHARPEEGSEHYFAYCAENHTGSGWPHGELVGPGILLMAGLQGQETSRLESALHSCHIPLQRIPAETTRRTLQELPEYCIRHGLPYGIAHTLKERAT